MSLFHTRVNSKASTLFDKSGEVRAQFSDKTTKFTSASIDLGVTDPGRITANNYQMNPSGAHVPSTVVSPQPTWLPALPKLNIAMTMLFAIMAVALQLEEEAFDSDGPSYLGKPIKRTNFQILDFDAFLPEDVTSG